MVSGQLDADRLDYLMRDSLFTGVDYGKFDLERILRIILPYQDQIVVKRTGLHTVEAYLLARYFMYWQVYFHPVCRSAEIVLRKALERARDVAQAGARLWSPHAAFTAWLTGAPLDLEAYLALDDHLVLTALEAWRSDPPDAILADLAGRLLDRRLFRYADFPEDLNPRRFGDIERAVRQAGFAPQYYLEADETAGVYYDYYVGAEGGEGADSPLYLFDGTHLTEMSRLSRPIQAIARERQRERRLFFPEAVAPAVAAVLAHRGSRG
jgi:HD superfamily phosphohydrolase